jgi:signal transduction histidine kinase
VAHELRGPLLASKFSLEGVLKRGTHDADLDLLRWSHAELNELASTIELLLRWTVAGRMPRRRKTDVVRLVRSAVGSVVRETGQSRVRVGGPDHLIILAVPAAIRASVANLIRNALAYSPTGTEVDVTIEDRDATACIRITDRGRGVSVSDRDSIFEPFIRGEQGRGCRSGHGLGLFIAQKMVGAHGGEIRIEPRREGVTFAIEVPVA